MSKLSEQIFELHKQNKSYNEIQKILKCSKGTISYHLGLNQKEKNSLRSNKSGNKITKKIIGFQRKYEKSSLKQCIDYLSSKVRQFQKGDNMKFTKDDVIKKFGIDTKCYLTGEPINLNKTNTYEFDHIIPKSRGGDNSINNLQICTKKANRAKHDLTPEEFIYLCKQILENDGYICSK